MRGVIPAAVLAFALVAPATGCGPTAPVPPPPPGLVAPEPPYPSQVDVAGLKAALDAGKVPLLLDVRSRLEFASGHVPGSVNVPIDEVEGRLGELSPWKDGPIYVICKVGGRSATAAVALRRAGFHPVDVLGGTSAWLRAGYPTE